METLLTIIQISLIIIGMLCYLIANIKKYVANKKAKTINKDKLFEMYKKYFKETQAVEQSKTTTQEIKELETIGE